jgi:hypothetical protein
MKKIIFFFIALLTFTRSYAQNTGLADDMEKIVLGVYVPAQVDKMPEIARSILVNKLSQIATQNGMGGNGSYQRFIITANVVVINKDLTSTAPPMTALSLEVSIYIGDGIDGVKFTSTSLTVNGAGTNETKAYISALKNINVTNLEIQHCVASGKAKIIQYYNTKCDYIIKEAQGLASEDRYDEALFKLTSVPEVCKDCYTKSVDAVGSIYKKEIDNVCQSKLAKARNVWVSNQNIDGANEASSIIADIDPRAASYNDVRLFVEQIAKKIKELNQRSWNYKLKQQQQANDVIKAARDIGLEYARNQPVPITCNVIGWW